MSWESRSFLWAPLITIRLLCPGCSCKLSSGVILQAWKVDKNQAADISGEPTWWFLVSLWIAGVNPFFWWWTPLLIKIPICHNWIPILDGLAVAVLPSKTPSVVQPIDPCRTPAKEKTYFVSGCSGFWVNWIVQVFFIVFNLTLHLLLGALTWMCIPLPKWEETICWYRYFYI